MQWNSVREEKKNKPTFAITQDKHANWRKPGQKTTKEHKLQFNHVKLWEAWTDLSETTYAW